MDLKKYMEKIQIQKLLLNYGYDGIIYQNEYEGDEQEFSIAVFEPNQIKSIYTNDFDIKSFYIQPHRILLVDLLYEKKYKNIISLLENNPQKIYFDQDYLHNTPAILSLSLYIENKSKLSIKEQKELLSIIKMTYSYEKNNSLLLYHFNKNMQNFDTLFQQLNLEEKAYILSEKIQKSIQNINSSQIIESVLSESPLKDEINLKNDRD